MSSAGISSEKKTLFETVSVPKAIMTMAVPTIISQLINLVYNIVDTFYIGRTGNPVMMASVTVSYTIFVMTIAFSNLFGIGGGSQMARLSGMKEYTRAKEVSSFSFYSSIGIALLYSAMLAVFQEPLLYLLGASEKSIVYARQYVFYTLILGNVPTILSTTIAHLLRNNGYSRQASFGLSAGGVLNIILDPLLMFKILPAGQEVRGAALATMISNIFACTYLLIRYAKLTKTTILDFNIKNLVKIKKEDVKQIFSVGVPSSLLTVLFDFSNMFLNAHMSGYGDLAVAAIGICLKVERFPNAVCIGLCQGTMPIIAYNFSSGNRKRMNEAIKVNRLYGLAVCAFSVIMFTVFAKKLTGLFLYTGSTDREGAMQTIIYATSFLRIRCLASPLQLLNYQPSFSMQAMGDGRDTLIHSVVRILGFHIPFMFVLNRLFGMYALTSSFVFGELCGAVFALVLLAGFIRRTNLKGTPKNPE